MCATRHLGGSVSDARGCLSRGVFFQGVPARSPGQQSKGCGSGEPPVCGGTSSRISFLRRPPGTADILSVPCNGPALYAYIKRGPFDNLPFFLKCLLPRVFVIYFMVNLRAESGICILQIGSWE